MELEDILKSSNSNTSDYCFLLENLDSCKNGRAPDINELLALNNLPKELLHTSSSLSSREQEGSHRNLPTEELKENNNPKNLPNSNSKEIREYQHFIKGDMEHNFDTANTSPITRDRVNRLSNMPLSRDSQPDLSSDSDDELISIEDTYKEQYQRVGRASIDSIEQEPTQKSMTIIHEEDLEESEANFNIQSQHSLLQSREVKNMRLSRKGSQLAASSHLQHVSGKEDVLKESFETFGGAKKSQIKTTGD